MIILFSFAASADAADGNFGGGAGTPSNPFVIEDEVDLAAISSNLDKHFILGQDIVMTQEWTPLGTSGNPFTGSFDGQNYLISNLNMNSPSGDSGLFGYADNATIKNVTLTDVTIRSTTVNNVGALIGQAANNTLVENCIASGTVSGRNNIGGLIGRMQNGVISNSHFSGTVTGNGGGVWDDASGVGGLAGFLSSSTISGSSATGDVNYLGNVAGWEGWAYQVSTGGFVGILSHSTITDSSSIGNTNGFDNVGGFAGYAWMHSTISNSYVEGNVVGKGNGVGGFAGGTDMNLHFINVSVTGDTTGVNQVGGLVGYTWYGNSISKSRVTGNTTGMDEVGGFIGRSTGTTISDSFVIGNVRGEGNGEPFVSIASTGGFVGYSWGESVFSNSFAAVNITGTNNVGGFAGMAVQSTVITNVYVTGSVDGNNNVGGLVGNLNGNGKIQNSMALNEFVNGTTNINSDIGNLGSGSATGLFVWENISQNDGTFTNVSDVTSVTSYDVWSIYPTNSIWSTFDTDDWVL
ncbi:MAG: hypothetical protein LBE57_05005, partial [Methanosarcinales archaeon]|nr:hypothetical protein [Methanosarcinales archaeon]